MERRQRLGPPLLIAAMLVGGLALNLPYLLGPDETAATPRMPLWVLAACFLAFELVVLHVPLGRDLDNAEEFNLTEVVIVLGLVLASPRDLILATTGVAAGVNLVRRIQTPTKQAFNAASRFFDAGVALAIYHLLLPADPLSFAGWGASAAAVVASGVTSSAMVTLVLLIVVGRIPARDLALSIISAVPLTLACSAVGFVAVVVLTAEAAGALPLLLAGLSLLLVMRSTSVLTERHLNLVSLHAFGEQVLSAATPQALVTQALDTAADLLVAREAVAYLVPPGTDTAQLFTRADDGAHVEWVSREEVPTARGLTDGGDRLVSAASLAAEGHIVFVVSGRATGMGGFRREDARVLDMVAHRTGSDLRNRQLIEQLTHDALHDPLTGLANRSALLASVRTHADSGVDLVATWLGLAGLQQVNAALGHDVGDELLVQVGARLVRNCGPAGEVSRVGGDEFVVLEPLNGAASPRELARLLLVALEAPFTLSHAPVLVRASAGFAVLHAGTSLTAEDLLRRADIAMRYAQIGGHTMEEYRPELESATPELLTLATELQTGINAGQLVLHGQPQVRLADGAIIGVEMLVRWDHPARGLLPPGDFLPLAESTGLERPLTDWVLGAAIAALAEWSDAGLPVTVSVNVPPSSLADTHLLLLLEVLLAKHGVPGELLVLEVVESGLITSAGMAAEVLQGFSDLGARVSIDDFGTGFSSLSHLRHLPVDEIKVDKSFVSTMLTDEDDAAIVQSVISMGRSLGLTVVAEGVETQEVYDALRALGCEAAQGYFMARPMPLAALTELLRSSAVAAPEARSRP